MLPDHDLAIITKIAKKYGATKVILFGSATQHELARDIDIGVEGIKPEQFFKFYGELLRLLDRPVDLVDLNEQSMIVDYIREEGITIYG